MSDTQIIAIALIFLAALASVMFNNARIGDLRTDTSKNLTDVGRRIDELRDSLNQRIDDMKDSVNTHIEDKFNLLMERLQRMEDNLTHQMAGHENRIQRLEEKIK